MKVIVKRHPKFEALFNPPAGTRVIVLMGGRGSGKTHNASVSIPYHIVVNNKRVQVLREEATTIKNSIINEIMLKWDKANKEGALNLAYEKTENTIKNRKTGEEVLFSKGFRASSNDKTAHMKGVSNVDIGVVEEMADIRDEIKFNTWKSGIRGKDSFVVMILNTPDINHWVIKRFFTLEPITLDDVPEGYTNSDIEGYYKCVPKKMKGVEIIITSYKDNLHLPDEVVEEYEAYGVKGGDFEDIHYYLTEILGFASSGRKGAIFKGWTRIRHEDYLNLDANKYYYLDWGSTDPTAIGEIKIEKQDLYWKALLYRPTKDTKEVAIELCRLGFTNKEIIICDSAKPDAILELRRGYDERDFNDDTLAKYPQLRYGFNTVGVPKPNGAKLEGIRALQGMNVHVCDDNLSNTIWDEYLGYLWELDRNMNPTGQPMDGKDHHLDGGNYVIGVYKNIRVRM